MYQRQHIILSYNGAYWTSMYSKQFIVNEDGQKTIGLLILDIISNKQNDAVAFGNGHGTVPA